MEVNLDIVWVVTQRSLPELKRGIEVILEQINHA